MSNNKQTGSDNARTILAIVAGGTAFGLLFVMWVYPQIPTAAYTLAALLMVELGALFWLNQRAVRDAVKSRNMRYGANAVVTTGLVLAIVTVLSYLNFTHFVRKDLTRNKNHSLSDQTIKIVKELKADVKLSVFTKTVERDIVRPLIDNYLYANKGAAHAITVEWVDPDREPVRTKSINVKKYGTIVVTSGKREARVEEANEEKLTNAFLKVAKDNAVTVCFLTGHGERDMNNRDPEGYSKIVSDLASQNYESKSVNIGEEAKIPEICNVLMILGPTKDFFPKEMAVLNKWLDDGGRAFIALDPNVKSGQPLSTDIKDLLKSWWVKVPNNLVIDPASKVANMSASVPLVGLYSKESPITRDFTAAQISFFPLTSTIEIETGLPTTINAFWLARSTPYAFAKSDFVKELLSGKVSKDPNKDTQGPNTVMLALAGSRLDVKKPEHPTRIVIAGTSQLGANRWVGYGGNSDLVLNAVSWLVGDESLISIRPKDEGEQKAAMSEVELSYSKFLTKLVMPFSTMILGMFVWRRRKRL